MLFASAPDPAASLPGPRLEPDRNATLTAVRAALTVTPVKGSRVLEVSFTSEDPVIAAAAANDAMDVYVKSQLGAKYGAVAKAREWLEQRREELRKDVRRYEDAIAQYRAQNGLIEGMHARLDSEQISLLTENLARARSTLAEAEGKLDAARGQAGAAAQAAIAPSVVQLRAHHDQLSAQLQSMLGRLGAGHPDVQALRAQLADVDRTVAAEIGRVVAAIDADVRADRERVAALQRDLSEQQSQTARDAQAQVPLNAMLRDAEASRGLLQAVLERIQQTAQQPSVEMPDAHEISLALVPNRPSFPRTVPWMAAATAFGIVLGLLLVYVMRVGRRHVPQWRRCARRARATVPWSGAPRTAAQAEGHQRRGVRHTSAAFRARRAASRAARRLVAGDRAATRRGGDCGAGKGGQDDAYARTRLSRGAEWRTRHRGGLRHPASWIGSRQQGPC